MHIERVRDAASDAVADYARLTDVTLRSAHEPANGLYIAESAKVIRRAIGAGHRPRSVLMEEKWLAGLEPSLDEFDIPVHLADPEQLEAITGYRVHRGALAAFERPALPDPAALLANARRVVVLEDIVDHTNVGAIFRSVAALGADAVLVSPRCADPLYRRSVRVSMGTVFQVPWTRLPEWPEARTDAARPRLLDRRPGPRRRRGLAPRPRGRSARATRARLRRRGRRAQQERARGRRSTSSRSRWRTASTRSTSLPPPPSCSTPSRSTPCPTSPPEACDERRIGRAEAERAGVPPAAHRRVQRPRPGARAVHDRRRLLRERARRAHPRGAAGRSPTRRPSRQRPRRSACRASARIAVGAVGFEGLLAAGEEQRPMPMASITKVITALVVLDANPIPAGEGGPEITYTEADVDIYWDQVAAELVGGPGGRRVHAHPPREPRGDAPAIGRQLLDLDRELGLRVDRRLPRARPHVARRARPREHAPGRHQRALARRREHRSRDRRARQARDRRSHGRRDRGDAVRRHPRIGT